MALRVVFRADASQTIGTGHVMRCLTLAGALSAKGADILFICREHEGHLCDLIEERGHAVHRLPPPGEDFSAEDCSPHAAWLGASWEDDAEQTRSVIQAPGGRKPDWLIVDHYGIDHRWERTLRQMVDRIFVIDDLADRNHDCDLLLDQNLVPDMQNRYTGRVPEGCPCMLGPEYALLQPIYAELHDRIPPREGLVRRILISFGGADSDNLTGRVLEAFISLDRPDIQIDVVVSNENPHTPSIRQQIADHPNIHLHGTLPTLAHLMAKADLAIGAAGSTSWERLCLGLPALVVTLAENQRMIAEGLSQEGLVRWLGNTDEASENCIQQALAEVTDKALDEGWSVRCHNTVDGRGANRVSAVLTITSDTPLQIRHARLSDERLILSWANDPETRRQSFSSDPISLEEHRRWFRDRLRDIESCKLYIVESEEGIPIGQVRFEKKGDSWEIDYTLDPHFRKRGLGRSLLEVALRTLRSECSDVLVFGRVKVENIPSRKVFESLGFESKKSGGGWSISVCSDSSSWINSHITSLIIDWVSEGHEVRWAHEAADLPKGDICFYLSYGKIVSSIHLANHSHNLVVHESDLPKGRGWSPLTWQVLEAASRIPVTLFEAAESVDSGDIYLQEWIELEGNELVDDLRSMQADATIKLCKQFVREYPEILKSARPQLGEATYYPRRRPVDSEIDLDRTIREQFNLLRVADNKRYPVWFEMDKIKFYLSITKGEQQF